MGAPTAKKPTLPPHLLKQLGAKDSPQSGGAGAGSSHGRRRQQPVSRKERRKAEREQSKARSRGRKHFEQQVDDGADDAPRGNSAAPNKGKTRAAQKGPGKVEPNPRRKRQAERTVSPEAESGEDDFFEGSLDESLESGAEVEEDEGDEDEDEDEDEEEEEEQEQEARPKKPIVSKAVKDQLAKDAAEIAALERKLGIKKRKLPKSFEEDGLDDLLGGLDSDGLDEDALAAKKRKTEADEWLARKRMKAGALPHKDALGSDEEGETDGDDDDDDDDDDDIDDGSDDDLDLDDDEEMEDGSEASASDRDSFNGFSSDDEAPEKGAARVRENPYVAPSAGNVAKYVPPSRRRESGSEAELTARIRRHAQGLVNRITDSNLISILGDIEKLYREYPRQHVSTTLVDLLLIQVCDRVSLPDTLLILSAGFATAIYRTIGVDFGAQLVQETVERFDQYYKHASQPGLAPSDTTKETSNIITFVSQLYTFQLLGSTLVFDYIRMLLDDLSELNAELLLRVIRMCGSTLRQDDPLALKDIVTLIRPAVAKVGEQNLSVRTKFMIETINDLKNNKMKTGINASAIVSEHVTRMKKLLGPLNARKLKATEPLGFGLKDIRESDKRGKWWLVGASWAGKSSEQESSKTKAQAAASGGRADKEESDDESIILSSEGEDGDGEIPDLLQLAREQKITTATQQSIFVAILSSADYQDAYARLQKLRLNKDRRGDIPTVLMQCVGAEEHYNPYYSLIANKMCATDRKVRYSFQDSLWKFFRRIGQPVFEDEADEADEDPDIDMRRVVNVAKMFGSLVARDTLGLSLLKCLDMPYLQPKAKAFVEVMLVTTLLEARRRKALPAPSSAGGDGDGDDDKPVADSREAAVARVFTSSTTDAPELARGLRWFLRKVIRKTDLVTGKDAEIVQEGRKVADAALEKALTDVVDGI